MRALIDKLEREREKRVINSDLNSVQTFFLLSYNAMLLSSAVPISKVYSENYEVVNNYFNN